MKIDDNELKRLLQEGMEYEADLIMREVESDPNIKEAVAPEDLHVNLLKQIREREEAVEKEKAEQEKEEQELIRLGKKYKKKLSRRKYIILIAAVVCALAVGSVSFGDGRKVIQEVKGMITGKTQLNIDDNGERTREVKSVGEEEAFQEIEDVFGLWAVRMSYLPEGMEFEEAIIEENLQNARLYYRDANEKNIMYYVSTNYRESSIGMDVEDKFIQAYNKDVDDVNIQIQEYLIENSQEHKWLIDFLYENTKYSIMIIGINEAEVHKIIENLYFS